MSLSHLSLSHLPLFLCLSVATSGAASSGRQPVWWGGGRQRRAAATAARARCERLFHPPFSLSLWHQRESGPRGQWQAQRGRLWSSREGTDESAAVSSSLCDPPSSPLLSSYPWPAAEVLPRLSLPMLKRPPPGRPRRRRTPAVAEDKLPLPSPSPPIHRHRRPPLLLRVPPG